MIRYFLFAILLLTLNVQSVAAIAMPFCQHQPVQLTMFDKDHAAHGHEQAQDDFRCDDCASCQTCATPAIPAVALISLPEAMPSLIIAAPVYLSLFVPEQPQPPPLSQAV
ncbi:MAG: hypothetical protein ACREV9_15700 [Burkholderiales bacterium]